MPSLSSPTLRLTHETFRSRPSKKRSFSNQPCIVQSIFNLASQGHLSQAISSLELLARKGLRLPSNSLSYLLQQCANARSLREAKWVHLHLKLTGLKHPTTFLSNQLISTYFKCGDEVEARKVFDKMSARNLYSWNNMLSGYAKMGMIKQAKKLFDKMLEKDVVSWNTMVIAYAKSGHSDEALRFYRELRRLSIGYNEFSFAGVLTVCVKLKELELARQVHGQVLVAGFLSNVVISSSVVDAYAKCGEMGDARRIFDDMSVRDVLAWTTLVSGYAKWGDMESASELFDRMPEKNPVSWTALIAGYARNALGHEALELFTKMMTLRVRPDQFTFSSCLCACASVASLKHGKQLHAYLLRTNFRPNTIVVSSLIDMYSKCGEIKDGLALFDCLPKKDAVCWTGIIVGCGNNGRATEAIKFFNEMVELGLKPNEITFTSILSACRHAGLVEEARIIFKSMKTEHGVEPQLEHYCCRVDLLGQAGCFKEAEQLIADMPFKPNKTIWCSLLRACGTHNNMELVNIIAEHLLASSPEDPSVYVTPANVYATSGMWDSLNKLREAVMEMDMKEAGKSWIETSG